MPASRSPRSSTATGETVHTDRGAITAPLIVDALGWRRVLGPGENVQPPDALISRGLEVHPHGGGVDLDCWIDRSVVRYGYAWSVPADGEQRVGVGSYEPRHHVKEPTKEMARRLDVDAVRYQGNWFPHALRPAAEDGVFFAGDSAGHCLPLSGEGIRTAFYFGIACGRELRAVLAGERTREQALAAYGAFSDEHAGAYRRDGPPPALGPAPAAARADLADRAGRPPAAVLVGVHALPRGRPPALRRGLLDSGLHGGHRLRRARARPLRDPGRPHRRGADAGLHERRGAGQDGGDGRAAPVEPLARRALAQGRDVGQHPGRARAALRLRRRRDPRARRPRRPGLPHRRAHVLLPGRPRRPPRTRRCPASSARSPSAPPARTPRAPTPRACSPTRGSPGRRCRRRPRRSSAPRARSPTSASPKRPPTCSTT